MDYSDIETPMISKPLISVVIPTYNRAEPTIAAIRSVLAQTYTPLELLVVDDGSTDGSSALVETSIRSLASEGHDVHYLRKLNEGSSSARNLGIERARGEHIAFLDSDDVWLPEKLAIQVDAFEQLGTNCGACYTDSYCVDANGGLTRTFAAFQRRFDAPVGVDRGALEHVTQSFCGFWVSTLLARTDVIRRIGGFDRDIVFVEDRDLSFRLSLTTEIGYVNCPLARIARTPTPAGSDCRPWDRAEVRLGGTQRMYEKWLGLHHDLPAGLGGVIRNQLRATHSDWANLSLEKREYRAARRHVATALQYKITPATLVKWGITCVAPGLGRRIFAKPAPYLACQL
ncbi:MAG TPA: glycosyltransferase family 2 protein [Acidobacteriaceae bacterium]